MGEIINTHENSINTRYLCRWLKGVTVSRQSIDFRDMWVRVRVDKTLMLEVEVTTGVAKIILGVDIFVEESLVEGT